MSNINKWHLVRQGSCQRNKIVNLIQQKSLLGRSEEGNNILLVSNFVSRTHCFIELEAEKVFITHKGGTNGTFVNNEKIKKRTEIKEGDVIGIGCNSTVFGKNPGNENYYIFQLKSGLMEEIETIELLDSDDESEVIEVNNNETPNAVVNIANEPKTELPKVEPNKEIMTVVRVQEVHDIDDLCDNLTANSGIAEQNGFSDGVIELSDEEDEIKYNNWVKLLSQGSSQSPRLSMSNSEDDSSSSVQKFVDKLIEDVTHESIFETPETSPEPTMPPQSDKLVATSDAEQVIPDPQVQSDVGTTKAFDFHSDLSADDAETVKIRTFSINIPRLSNHEVNKYLGRSSRDTPEIGSNEVKTKHMKEIQPSKKIRKIENAERLRSLCDPESDTETDNDEKGKTPEKNVSDPPIDKQSKTKLTRTDSTDQRTKSINVNSAIYRREAVPQPSTSTASPKTVEQVTNKIMKPIKQPIPIIEAPRMPKRRSSMHEAVPPKRRKSSSFCSDKPDPAVSLASVDMFSIASNKRNGDHGNAVKRRMSEGCSETDEQRLQLQRREKLKNLQKKEEKAKQSMDKNGSRVERVSAKPRVKVTVKNRGIFLTEIPDKPIVPVKKSSSTVATRPGPVCSKNVYKVAQIEPKETLSSLERPGPACSKNSDTIAIDTSVESTSRLALEIISQFKKKHVVQEAPKAAPSTSANQTPSDASLNGDDGICNNLRFYGENKVNITLPPGFYKQMDFSQNTLTPVPDSRRPGSILKSPSGVRKSNKTVTFSELELEEIREFDCDLEPEQIQTYVPPAPSTPDPTPDPLPHNLEAQLVQSLLEMDTNFLSPTEPIDESIHRELLRKIKETFIREFNSNFSSYDNLVVSSFQALPNGLMRIVLLPSEPYGYRSGSLLLLRIKNPITKEDSEKFGFITEQSANDEFQVRIVVEAKMSEDEIQGIGIIRSRLVCFLRSLINPQEEL